jgi:hypothetical protein
MLKELHLLHLILTPKQTKSRKHTFYRWKKKTSQIKNGIQGQNSYTMLVARITNTHTIKAQGRGSLQTSQTLLGDESHNSVWSVSLHSIWQPAFLMSSRWHRWTHTQSCPTCPRKRGPLIVLRGLKFLQIAEVAKNIIALSASPAPGPQWLLWHRTSQPADVEWVRALGITLPRACSLPGTQEHQGEEEKGSDTLELSPQIQNSLLKTHYYYNKVTNKWEPHRSQSRTLA